jgi:hypothetical protein
VVQRIPTGVREKQRRLFVLDGERVPSGKGPKWRREELRQSCPGAPLPFIRAEVVTSQRLISCNHTLVMDVIKGLNQFGIHSIKFTLTSKIRSENDFSFEFCWCLVKVFNTKVVPNTVIYLQRKFHIFLRSPCIFPDFHRLLR